MAIIGGILIFVGLYYTFTGLLHLLTHLFGLNIESGTFSWINFIEGWTVLICGLLLGHQLYQFGLWLSEEYVK